MKIESLNLSIRIKNVLHANQITEVDQLCTLTESFLLKRPNIGKLSIDLINKALAEIGRTLPDSREAQTERKLEWACKQIESLLARVSVLEN